MAQTVTACKKRDIKDRKQQKGSDIMAQITDENKGEQTGTVKYKKIKERKSLISYIFAAIVIFLVIYAVIAIIAQQAQIVREEENLNKLREEITEAQQINDEYTRILSAEDEKAYMERIAIERMGYGYPGEKRFYAMD